MVTIRMREDRGCSHIHDRPANPLMERIQHQIHWGVEVEGRCWEEVRWGWTDNNDDDNRSEMDPGIANRPPFALEDSQVHRFGTLSRNNSHGSSRVLVTWFS